MRGCGICGESVTVRHPSRVERTRYCSTRCRIEALKEAAATRARAIKGKPGRKLSEEEKTVRRAKYSMFGSSNPLWKGGQFARQDGYHVSYVGRTNGRTNYQLEHRLIAERALGRPLKTTEIVHHIDMDQGNNSRGNLLICTQSYHVWLHNRMAEQWVREHIGRSS